MSLRDRLSQANGTWKQTEARKSGFKTLPPGRYHLKINAPSSGAWVEENSDGAVRLRIPLEVVGANDESLVGQPTSKSYTLIQADGSFGEMGMSILKGDLEVLGVELPELPKIGVALDSVVGTIVSCNVQTTEREGNVYNRIYFNSVQIPAEQAEKY